MRASARTATAPPGPASDWPQLANGELVSALVPGMEPPLPKAAQQDRWRDGQRSRCPARDPRFHPRPDDDPGLSRARPSPGQSRSARSRGAGLSSRTRSRRPTASRTISTGRSSSTTCSGSKPRPSREIVDILRRTYCGTIGVEFMHINEPGEKAWIQARIEGPREGDPFHRHGQAGDPAEAHRGGRLREVPERQIYRHQALRSRWRRVADPGHGADHQARRRSSVSRRSSSACRIAAG